MYLFKHLRFIPAIILGILALSACNSKLPRKKLPDFSSTSEWDNTPVAKTPAQPFYIDDTLIETGSRSEHFMEISLPDPQFDSLAMSMVKSYEPFASPLMDEWKKQDRKGIVIDLRLSAAHEMQRADFNIGKSLAGITNWSIPVVFLWDEHSTYRAAYFINAMKSLQGFSCKLVGNSYETGKKGRQDCFSPVAPDFNER